MKRRQPRGEPVIANGQEVALIGRLPTFDQGVAYLISGMNGAPAWIRNGANDLLWFNPRVSHASPDEVVNLRELAALVLQRNSRPPKAVENGQLKMNL